MQCHLDATRAAGSTDQRAAHARPPVWMTPPMCPKGCGRPLNETSGKYAEQGDWWCHGDHEGKVVWWHYELIGILTARLSKDVEALARRLAVALEGMLSQDGNHPGTNVTKHARASLREWRRFDKANATSLERINDHD